MKTVKLSKSDIGILQTGIGILNSSYLITPSLLHEKVRDKVVKILSRIIKES